MSAHDAILGFELGYVSRSVFFLKLLEKVWHRQVTFDHEKAKQFVEF